MCDTTVAGTKKRFSWPWPWTPSNTAAKSVPERSRNKETDQTCHVREDGGHGDGQFGKGILAALAALAPPQWISLV